MLKILNLTVIISSTGKIVPLLKGRKFKRIYSLKEDAQKSSVIQISRNYANAVRNMGGTVIFEGAPQNAECADRNGLQMVIGKVVKDGNEMWVEVSLSVDGNDYYLTIVLKELMKQDVTASDMFEALNRDGHIALYINFDTGKSVIRYESEPVIGQIVQMMKSNPELSLVLRGTRTMLVVLHRIWFWPLEQGQSRWYLQLLPGVPG